MNEQQFVIYTENMLRVFQDRKEAYENSDMRQVRDGVTNKLLKQTSFSDGSTDVSTRIWLDDIDLAFNRVGDNSIINIVTSSITGSLRKEIELYIREFMTANRVAREEVPWPNIREHVVKSFLNVDEAAALRDSVDHLHQSSFESEASFTRKFRDLAQKAYPVPRNVDQSRILVKAYARGLRSTGMAVKMIEQANPQTLPQAMTWVAGFSERSDAVSRLGLRHETERDEIPMEISAVHPTMPPAAISGPLSPQETATQMLGKLLRSQDKIMSKISKLEAAQTFGPGASNYSIGGPDKRQSRPKQPPQSENALPNWSQDGRPLCFGCRRYGHLKRHCREQSDWQPNQPRLSYQGN